MSMRVELSDTQYCKSGSSHAYLHLQPGKARLHTFNKCPVLFPIVPMVKNGKNMGTLGKLSTYKETIDIFDLKFVFLHLRYCCLA